MTKVELMEGNMMRQLIAEGLKEPEEPGFYIISNEKGDPIHSTWHFKSLGNKSEWTNFWNDRTSWEQLVKIYYSPLKCDLYIESLADRDARIRAEGILQPFEYDDYPVGHDGKLRVGDYVHVSRHTPKIGNVDFHAEIVMFSDEDMGIKPIPVFKIFGYGEEHEYASIRESSMTGCSFTCEKSESTR